MMWTSMLVGFLCIISVNLAFLIDPELPCDFVDSIDISTGIPHSNKSIIFNGMIFPEDQYAKVNYVLKDGTKPIIVEPYVRGCPCNIRPCIRLCCPFGTFAKIMTPEGSVECSEHETAWSFGFDVIDENNQTKIPDPKHHFGFVDRICKLHYYADAFKITNVNIKLYERFFFSIVHFSIYLCYFNYFFQAGDIWFENELVNHRKYCLEVTKGANNSTNIEAMICYEKADEYHVRYSILPYSE